MCILNFKSTNQLGRIWRNGCVSTLIHGARHCRALLREPSSCVSNNNLYTNKMALIYVQIGLHHTYAAMLENFS